MRKSKRENASLTSEFNHPYMRLLMNPDVRALAPKKLLIGIPMTGTLRSEWAMSRWNQIIPCNWGHSDCTPTMPSDSPLGYAVPEARNIVVDRFIKEGFEWLFFLDHDVILPPTGFVKIGELIRQYGKKYPVMCGLYFAKCDPPEPLIYRGRGNGHFTGWKLGDHVMVDGIPMGCTLIHRSIMKVMWDDAPEYEVKGIGTIKRVFDNPAGIFFDPETGAPHGFSGTEDLAWCNRVITGKYLEKSGWKSLAKERYPFLCDTGFFCFHITNDGQRYPLYVPVRHRPKGKPRGPK